MAALIRPLAGRLQPWRAFALLLALAAGCAASHPKPVAEVTAGPKVRVALIPLENLTLHEGASEAMTRVLFAEMVKRGLCEMVESGEVDAAMESLRARPTGSLGAQERVELARRLKAVYFLVGTVLEYDVARTPEGDVPAVALALKVIDASDGRVVWADMRVRTGDDHERIFGWGRENSRERLSGALAAEMLAGVAFPAGAPTPAPGPAPKPAPPGGAPPDSLHTGSPR